jgi:hypothetical protein
MPCSGVQGGGIAIGKQVIAGLLVCAGFEGCRIRGSDAIGYTQLFPAVPSNRMLNANNELLSCAEQYTRAACLRCLHFCGACSYANAGPQVKLLSLHI